eukprot:PLAT7707.1.p1 GENE.PLAT7707.1~~PLAT7707.1.p1  ORF type:complete len:417 (-),score=161.04 PLAT7707.1:63-1313(-)
MGKCNKLFFATLLAVVLLSGWLRREGDKRSACAIDLQRGGGTLCGFQSPEDVAAVEWADVLLVSNLQIPGHSPKNATGGFLSALTVQSEDTLESMATAQPRQLWPLPGQQPGDAEVAEDAANLGDPACGRQPPSIFRPHGISVLRRPDGRTVVAVMNHGRESVEFFWLQGSGDAARLTWLACVALPADARGNDLMLSDDGSSIFAAKFMPEGDAMQLLYMIEGTQLKRPTGSLLYWQGSSWRPLPSPYSLSLANGAMVLHLRDGELQPWWTPTAEEAADADAPRWLYVTQSGTGLLCALPYPGRKAASEQDSKQRCVELPGILDNIGWSQSSGRLLITSHEDNFEFAGCMLRFTLPCTAGWRVYEVHPHTLEASLLFKHDGQAVGAVSGAEEMYGLRFYAAVFDDRIGVTSLHGTL